MRSAGGLMPRILTWENFVRAAHSAARGKRDRPAVQAFFRDLDRNIAELIRDVRSETVLLGESNRFVIRDPKKREICAPLFPERVLHHALMNECEPVLERRLIHDTYACRCGKGQQAAVQRAVRFAGGHRRFLKMDIRRFFDSVDHGVLKGQLAEVFRERALVDLLWRIIDAYQTAPGKGLPIGSLMSQHFANWYLNPLDRFLKETRRVHAYVRYMDDSAVWGDTTGGLVELRDAVAAFVEERLALRLKDVPYINDTSVGMDFLGYRVFPGRTVLARRSRRRFARKMRRYAEAYEAGSLSQLDLQHRLQALCAFTQFARSWQFRRGVLQRLPGEI